jgi:hypothetical protein
MSQYKLLRIGGLSSDKNVERSSYKVALKRKSLLIRMNLRRRHYQLLFIMSKTVKQLLFNGIYEAAFHLCSLYNNIVALTSEHTKNSSGSLMISNTYTAILSTPRRMDITCILQLVTKCRMEACCSNLIACLLANSRADLQYDDDDSDTSSLLVFHALTKELSQSEEFMSQHQQQLPAQQKAVQSQSKGNETKEIKLSKPATVPLSKNDDDPALNFFDNLTAGNEKSTGDNVDTHVSEAEMMMVEHGELLIELIRAEEIFIAHIIVKCLKFCPSAFDGEINKNEIIKLIEKASRFLWTHISGTLENYVLWWNQSLPLASRPIGCAKYLREWLLTHADAPEPILATLKSLGEILTIHVIGCLWDKQFRRCLILANNSNNDELDEKFDRNSEFHCHDERVSIKSFSCSYQIARVGINTYIHFEF